MAATAAQTIVSRWNTYRPTLGYIPALLDGSNLAATTPMIEGLVYPVIMGLTNAVDRTGGPYAAMLQALSNHTSAVLVPGKCLPWGWLMTSANIITWQSKIFICQYVAEAVLGITNNAVNGSIDQIHASIQLEAGPREGFVDATDGTGNHHFAGGVHYPRAVTTSLWWLTATNNPAYPAANAVPEAPVFSGVLAGDRQVLLLWQGVPFAAGYHLSRSTTKGGPYATVAAGVPGANFMDSGLQNGITYYYILTATNAFGESLASPEVSATPVPSVGTRISASLSAEAITLSWPADYVGWILQTNQPGPWIPTAWGDVPGSRTQSQMSFPVGGQNGSATFFRLRHP
jgi:hypothetical protein